MPDTGIFAAEPQRSDDSEPPKKVSKITETTDLSEPPKETRAQGPIQPQKQKGRYIDLGGSCQLGFGVYSGFPRIYIRKLSGKVGQSSQYVSMIFPEWKAFCELFGEIDQAIEGTVKEKTWNLPGNDKVVKLFLDDQLSKISVKRKIGEKMKGASLSLSQYDRLKAESDSIFDMVDQAYSSSEPYWKSMLNECVEVVLAWKLAPLLVNDDGSKMTEWTDGSIGVKWNKFVNDLNVSAAQWTIFCLAMYMKLRDVTFVKVCEMLAERMGNSKLAYDIIIRCFVDSGEKKTIAALSALTTPLG